MRGEITVRGRAPRPSARIRMPRCRLSRRVLRGEVAQDLLVIGLDNREAVRVVVSEDRSNTTMLPRSRYGRQWAAWRFMTSRSASVIVWAKFGRGAMRRRTKMDMQRTLQPLIRQKVRQRDRGYRSVRPQASQACSSHYAQRLRGLSPGVAGSGRLNRRAWSRRKAACWAGKRAASVTAPAPPSVARHVPVRGPNELPIALDERTWAAREPASQCISTGQRHMTRAEGERSVKPSADPTLVRTQHLPPPAKTAPWLRKRDRRAVFFLSRRVSRRVTVSRCVAVSTDVWRTASGLSGRSARTVGFFTDGHGRAALEAYSGMR